MDLSSSKKLARTTYCFPVWQSLNHVFRKPKIARKVKAYKDELEKITTLLKQVMFPQEKNVQKLRYCFSAKVSKKSKSGATKTHQGKVPDHLHPVKRLENASRQIQRNTDSEASYETSEEEDDQVYEEDPSDSDEY